MQRQAIPSLQRGFTLIELLVVGITMAILVTVTVNLAVGQYHSGMARQAYEDAMGNLKMADSMKRQVLTTTVDASGITHHTYNEVTTWTPASTVNANNKTSLIVNTAYPTPFMILAPAHGVTQVQYDVPAGEPTIKTSNSTVVLNGDGSSTVTVFARELTGERNRLIQLQSTKVQVYGEDAVN